MKCITCGSENIDGAHFCATCGATLATAEKTDENSLIGVLVGNRYLVKSVLGEGGMGIVYSAEQKMGTTTRKVALKTLHAHLSHDPSIAARFNREVGTIAQLEHPNTIKVYDFGATPEGTLYIAMEFVAGKSLSQLLQESGALEPARVLKIMRQVAGSLEEAHGQGVIHRDLKPDNVVLTQRAGEKDVVKLLDFGIAARTEGADAAREQKLTQQGMVLGTPPYMSPEQFTGKPLDARSDIYSLGVMAYEMLTGRLPFEADTPWQWATEHMTAQPKPFEATPTSANIPPEMQRAIMRALAKNKEDRQSTVTQFYEELAGITAAPGAGFAVASTGTAAMVAPPGFAQPVGPGKTAAMVTPGAMPSPVAASPTAPGVPIPVPTRATPKSGHGLVYGLAGVGGVLVIAIVIVVSRSMRSSSPDAAAAQDTATTGATTAAAPSAPPTQIDPTPTNTAEPVEPTTPAKPSSKHHEPGTEPTNPSSPSTPVEPSRPIEPSRPVEPSRPPEVTPPTASGCGGCLSAANSGNIVGAASAYNSCRDASQRAQCVGVVRGRAVQAAQAAAFNGHCPQAKAIAAAAEGMGVPPGQFRGALATCK